MEPQRRDAIVLIFGTGVTALLSLAYVVYAQRVLGPESSAEFMAAVALISLFHIGLGPINATVTRFTAGFAERGELGKARSLSRAVSQRVAKVLLIGFVLGLLMAKPLAGFLHFGSAWTIVIAFGTVYLLLLLSVARGTLRGLHAFGSYALNTMSESLVRLAAGCVLLAVFVAAPPGILAYTIATICALILARFQLASVWLGVSPEPVDGAAVKRFVLPMFLVMLTSAGFQNVDMIAVKHYFAGSEAGIYGAGFAWGRMFSAVVTPFTTLLLPVVAAMHERGERPGRETVRLVGAFLLLSIAPMFLVSVWPEWLIGTVQGPRYVAASSVMWPIAVARLLGHVTHMLALVGAATNNFRFLWVYVPSLLLQVLLFLTYHASLVEISRVLMAGHVVVLVLMLGSLVVGFVARRSRAES